MIETNMKNTLQPLKRVPCIHHLLYFQNNQLKTRVLIDLGNEVNTITSAYAAKLDLKIRKTNIEV